MSGRTLRADVLDALAGAGTWVAREALDALTTCAPALDDVLADLVVEGRAEFRQFVGYRLALSPLARQSLQKLKQEPLVRRVVSAYTAEKNGRSMVRVGVAERRADLGGAVVTYDMALPVCDSPDAALAQAQAWMHFLANGGLANV
jgi:hypothetical protein